MEAAGTSLVLPNWALITPLQKRKFLRSAAQGDPQGTSYVSAVDVPHCVVETAVDREGQGMVMGVLKH